MLNRRPLITLAVAAALAAAVPARAQDTAGRDLLQKVVDAAPRKPFVARAKLTSPSRGWDRDLGLYFKNLDGTDASYIEVTAPFDVKDTRFLMLDRKDGRDEQFIYVPAMKRAIQVSNETRKQPFLGSDFYVVDMVSPNLADYTHALGGQDKVGDRECTLVESVPNAPANELYSKMIACVDPKDLLIVRTQFFDAKGKAYKVWTIEQYDKVDGVWTPRKQRMENVQDNTESILEITEIKYDAPVSDETFTRAHLTR